MNNNIRLAKSSYYHKEIEDNIGNSRQIWKTINNLMSRKTKDSSINELKVKNVTVNEPSEIADKLNKHFTDIGNKLAANLSQSDCDYQQFMPKIESTFHLNKVTIKSVQEMLNSLLTGKATGLGNISAKLLKVASPVIAESLCVIFNKSVETGIFPTEWKKAKVFPVHKKDDKSDPNNYRPISVLPTIAKLLERLIYDQLYDYLTRNNL